VFQRGRRSVQPEIIIDPNGRLDERADNKARVGDREFDMGYGYAQPGHQGTAAGLRNDLTQIVGLARDADTSLYLVTYPTGQGFYHLANLAITAVATESDTPLIDLTAVFAQICPNPECPDALYPSGHPKASGYRIVAEAILRRLERRGDS
jgi:hypothetical protein